MVSGWYFRQGKASFSTVMDVEIMQKYPKCIPKLSLSELGTEVFWKLSSIPNPCVLN
jgi:hypothetical protein